MTSYTAIPNGDIDQDSPLTQPLLTALRDNPLAIAEAAAGAPVVEQGWHPYDSTINGTGDGKFYDSAIHGAVASVETPAFSAGFEYMVILESVGTTSAGSETITMALYRTAAAAYAAVFAVTPASTTFNQNSTGFVIIPLAQRILKSHIIDASRAG